MPGFSIASHPKYPFKYSRSTYPVISASIFGRTFKNLLIIVIIKITVLLQNLVLILKGLSKLTLGVCFDSIRCSDVMYRLNTGCSKCKNFL